MQTVLYSEARNNLREIINRVVDDFDEYLISTKDKKTAVLISQDEYNSLKETLYLLSSKNNRERLLDSIDEIENGNFQTKELLN
jgi:antitoxin YefM